MGRRGTVKLRSNGKRRRRRMHSREPRDPRGRRRKQTGVPEKNRRQREQEKDRRPCRSGSAIQAHRRNLGVLFAGQELRGRHAVRDRVRRIVEREFVAQAPRENADAQKHEAAGQQAQAVAAGDLILPGQIQRPDRECRTTTNNATGLDAGERSIVSETRPNRRVIYNASHANG
jgi:hypothetical protein